MFLKKRRFSTNVPREAPEIKTEAGSEALPEFVPVPAPVITVSLPVPEPAVSPPEWMQETAAFPESVPASVSPDEASPHSSASPEKAEEISLPSSLVNLFGKIRNSGSPALPNHSYTYENETWVQTPDASVRPFRQRKTETDG
ncbi:MAG: hypothetical protein LBT22_08230 [Peptococcaceae bacterium]|jgi:hypothetical protein|nr:hypothetical protein [Peptococcaceae bacterium]